MGALDPATGKPRSPTSLARPPTAMTQDLDGLPSDSIGAPGPLIPPLNGMSAKAEPSSAATKSAAGRWGMVRQSADVKKALTRTSWGDLIREIRETDRRLEQAKDEMTEAQQRLSNLTGRPVPEAEKAPMPTKTPRWGVSQAVDASVQML
uniref:Uncharacterized protein n=1 Tax=Haptolina brevifila TaxID=156173 RepID=A0A7S2IV56_9EUKA|mmetsp:Transcript_72187/g.143205  ORF Transcript_72187/g.143205 Transcript_72187/m.143205 type:complete len:150 (+) Transcript_72187:2-451(+)